MDTHPGAEAPSAPTVDVALHEERVQFGTDVVATRAVVRRRVVTEVQTLRVEVRREVLEVKHEPLDAPPVPGGASPLAPLVVELSREVPVVLLEVRPYERVSLEVHTVTGEQPVSTVVHSEQVELTEEAAG